jgi:hypothetical protein
MRFHLAPLTCHTRLRKRIEEALAFDLYSQPGLVGHSRMWKSATYPGAPVKSLLMSAASPRRRSSGSPRIERHSSRSVSHHVLPRARRFEYTIRGMGQVTPRTLDAHIPDSKQGQ